MSKQQQQLRALVRLEEAYTHHAVLGALSKSKLDWDIVQDVPPDNADADLGDAAVALQWLEYEWINWQHLASHPSAALANAYCIRKGLIRKAQFWYNVAKYVSKHPDSILRHAVPETWLFELDHVDYLDEALNEVFEVEHELRENDKKSKQEKSVFIIKPSMANKAAGIHVFDSLEQLQAIFEEEGEEDLTQVREWVIQRYIRDPLLVHSRKFHVRAYVLAVANIQVYLFREMLALFALKPYSLDSLADTLAHISNTCIQTDHPDFDEQSSVRLFWDLDLPKPDLDAIFRKMQDVLAHVFDACTSEMTTFQSLPNVFELFGVDFLIDHHKNVYFLEANAVKLSLHFLCPS